MSCMVEVAVSMAHSDEDIDKIIEATREVAQEMKLS